MVLLHNSNVWVKDGWTPKYDKNICMSALSCLIIITATWSKNFPSWQAVTAALNVYHRYVCNHSQRLDSIHAWTLHGQGHFLSSKGEIDFSSPDTPALHPKTLSENFWVNLIPEYKRDMNIWSRSSKGSKMIKG